MVRRIIGHPRLTMRNGTKDWSIIIRRARGGKDGTKVIHGDAQKTSRVGTGELLST